MSKPRNLGVAVFMVACVIGSCSSDDKESSTTSESLATEAMVPAIQALVTLGATISAGSADLDACPLGDFDGLVGQAPAAVQAMVTPDDELFAYVFQPEDQPQRHLQCGRGALGAYTGEVPVGDYRDDLIRILDDLVLTFEDDRDYRGGTVVRFCAEVIGVGEGRFCEADWYDGNIWIGVFIESDDGSSELADQWLIAILDDVVATVPQLAPGIQLSA